MTKSDFHAIINKAQLLIDNSNEVGLGACWALSKSTHLQLSKNLTHAEFFSLTDKLKFALKELLKPDIMDMYKYNMDLAYWLESKDLTRKENKMFRIMALELFRQICLTENIYKEF